MSKIPPIGAAGDLGALESGGKVSAAERRGKLKHDQPAKTKRGKLAHKASKKGGAHNDKPYTYGASNAFPNLVDDVRLRWWALPASGGEFELDVESCQWSDTTAITTGTITVRELNQAHRAPDIEAHLDQGDRIRLEASEGDSGFRPVWTMRLSKPQLTASTGQRTFNMANDLDLLRQSEDNFLYDRFTLAGGKSKKPGGWTGADIIADVCKRYGVPLKLLYTPDPKPLAKVRVRRGSPLEVIRVVLMKERRHHGRRLIIRWVNDELHVLDLQRSARLLELGPTLIEAAFQSELLPEFGSAIMMRGLPDLFLFTNGDLPKAKRQKAHFELESKVSRRLFGYVHRIVFSPDARTDAELREEGKAFLAAVAIPHKTVTLTHRGMPFLQRGDAIRLALGDDALRRQVVFVNGVNHRVQPGAYEMDVECIFDDPYRDRQRESIVFRLKPTAAQAIGNRARLNPTWMIPKNAKGDLPLTGTGSQFTIPTGSVLTDPNDPNLSP